MIKVNNVTKKYGKFYAVRNVSFEVKDGEIVGFLGRNGAGKSTTMNLITGFIEPTEGEIFIDGYSMDLKPKKAKAEIGYMPEGAPLYGELTVKEFITYMAELKLVPRKMRKEAVEKAIKATGLTKVQDDLTKILSKGYKQRVSFAGTIVGDPKILVLDEPTSGLDPKQVTEIRELIKAYGKNHTVFISSHILSEISQLCDKVIIIDKGEIVAIDTPENLEAKTSNNLTLEIIVDDLNNSIQTLKEKISDITDIEFIEEKEDNTKKYLIKTSTTNDIRKNIFAECAKEEISILEMKKVENSLEDAFLKLVEDRPEYTQKEVNKMQYNKEIEEIRQEIEDKKIQKENRKIAIKEEKARKKAEKEAKKESKNTNKQEEDNK